jgi:hypothetical protein
MSTFKSSSDGKGNSSTLNSFSASQRSQQTTVQQTKDGLSTTTMAQRSDQLVVQQSSRHSSFDDTQSTSSDEQTSTGLELN